jgi:magnesium-protoporphyrin O-methyltransferase
VLAQEAAARGADVTATDLSKSLIEIAQKRRPKLFGCGQLEFVVGDMLELDVGTFDYVVAMDSLIHYAPDHMIAALAKLAQKARCGVLFTYAPKTTALAVMHAIGRAFPRSDRAPAIQPISPSRLDQLLAAEPNLSAWYACRTKRVASGFYKSQAVELLSE